MRRLFRETTALYAAALCPLRNINVQPNSNDSSSAAASAKEQLYTVLKRYDGSCKLSKVVLELNSLPILQRFLSKEKINLEVFAKRFSNEFSVEVDVATKTKLIRVKKAPETNQARKSEVFDFGNLIRLLPPARGTPFMREPGKRVQLFVAVQAPQKLNDLESQVALKNMLFEMLPTSTLYYPTSLLYYILYHDTGTNLGEQMTAKDAQTFKLYKYRNPVTGELEAGSGASVLPYEASALVTMPQFNEYLRANPQWFSFYQPPIGASTGGCGMDNVFVAKKTDSNTTAPFVPFELNMNFPKLPSALDTLHWWSMQKLRVYLSILRYVPIQWDFLENVHVPLFLRSQVARRQRKSHEGIGLTEVMLRLPQFFDMAYDGRTVRVRRSPVLHPHECGMTLPEAQAYVNEAIDLLWKEKEPRVLAAIRKATQSNDQSVYSRGGW